MRARDGRRRGRSWSVWLASFLLAGCATAAAPLPGQSVDAPKLSVHSAGLRLPPGFRASIFARGIGPARHLTVRANGDVYVALQRKTDGGGVVGLRDLDHDGRADRLVRFGEVTGTGIAVRGPHLYFSSDTAVYRVALDGERLAPVGRVETVVSGFPDQNGHRAKSITFDDEGRLYVNVGAPSNACMEKGRTRGSPGIPDCPQLERQGGVWRFPAGQIGLTQQADGERFATGLRNCVALGWHPGGGRVFAVQHGRDQLRKFWKALYSAEQSAALPAEELHALELGSNGGWPYTYWDAFQQARMQAPEYGGDGSTEAVRGIYQDPQVAFPAHWGPNAIAFDGADRLPGRYRGGAFVAFHGSWNRAPLPQGGYNLVFVPFSDGRPTGTWEVFADGFAQTDIVGEPSDAAHRPTGVAIGPDGALYVSDSVQGRIWRITREGT